MFSDLKKNCILGELTSNRLDIIQDIFESHVGAL